MFVAGHDSSLFSPVFLDGSFEDVRVWEVELLGGLEDEFLDVHDGLFEVSELGLCYISAVGYDLDLFVGV